jgi:hypothetical protein
MGCKKNNGMRKHEENGNATSHDNRSLTPQVK